MAASVFRDGLSLKGARLDGGYGWDDPVQGGLAPGCNGDAFELHCGHVRRVSTTQDA